MIGRIVGVVLGAAIAVTGYGMLKPALLAKYYDFSKLSLGPFAEYKTVVCWIIVAFGVAVVLAALQRPSGRSSRKKRAGPVIFAPMEAEAEPTTAELSPAPEAEPHDDHHEHAEPAHEPAHAH